MTNGKRLVVLTSADPENLTAALLESLVAWCKAGLLGNVVWSSARDLASHGYDAAGWASLEGFWSQTTLGQAMASRALSEVSLAALRHPLGSGSITEREIARREEEEALESVAGLVGRGVSFTSMTVSVATPGLEHTFIDCSPSWGLHLIHDVKAEAHESAPRAVAAERAPMELSAMVALCASGGWQGSSAGIDIPTDRADGPMKPVRFAHCQMRVLLTPSVAQIALPSSMPTAPPWPLPQASGTMRAMPTAVPPLAVAEKLAAACDFQCYEPPLHPEPKREFVLVRLWRGLFRPVPVPAAPTDQEAALSRLANRTGGFREEDVGGVTPLRLEGADGILSLEHHIRRSDFPLAGGTSGASRSTPREWQTLREAMFGLVDGGPLPNGVPFPSHGEGGDVVRLVWTDPAGIATSRAPRDASDVFLGSEAPSSHLEEDGEQVEDLEAESPDTLLFELQMEAHEDGNAAEGSPDVLMGRMADSIRQALRSAHRGFAQHAALCSVGTEHDEAVRTQMWARRLLKLLAVMLAIGIVAVLDSWRPFLGPAWEFATPFEARRLLVSDLWPAGWLAIGILVLAGVTTLFSIQASRFLANFGRLQEVNAERHRLGATASHYASELLRLRSVAEQFADHRAIITEFLYRPFGVQERSKAITQLAPDLRFVNEPPPSMLVACAEPDPENVDALLNQQQAVSIQQGWLNAAYRQAIAAWSVRYQRRVIGEFGDPDHDDSPPGSVVHRDPRDGSDVFGARTDFLYSVASDPGDTRGGWAVRKAADERFAGLFDNVGGGTGGFLDLLGPMAPIHGAPAGIGHDPLAFMSFDSPPHWFDWNAVLDPGADMPRVSRVQSAGDPWLVPNASEGHSLVLAWRMDLSSPVRPQDLAGWQAGGGVRHAPELSRQRQVV